MTDDVPHPLVLASGSAVRAQMLRNAGIAFTVRAAAVDEGLVKASMRAQGADVATVAEALAATKAQQVSRRDPAALVIGADQMLTCDADWFDKPVDAAAAKAQLLALRGRMHRLISAVCVAQGGDILWHSVESARLTMRPFGEAFLDEYIDKMGEDITATVGCYEIEGLGIQLFSKVEGDCFTIQGMPLLPLLDFLRGHGIVGE